MDGAPGDLLAMLREGDAERYLSILYAPEAKRPALAALHAFDREIASIPFKVREVLTGEMRIQWWREVVTGNGAAASPVAAALVGAIERHALPVGALDAYLDARLADLYDDAFPDRTSLEAWCGATAGAILQLASIVLAEGAAASTADAAGHAACVIGIVDLLRRLPVDRARRRCVLPRDILAACATTPETFWDEPDLPAARTAVGAMAALARDHARRFVAAMPGVPAPARPAFLPVAGAIARLRTIERKPSSVLDGLAAPSALRLHAAVARRALVGWR